MAEAANTNYAIPEGVATFIYRRAPNGAIEFLLMLRHPDDGDFWQGPGGGIEHGETPEQTAIREISEECGLMIGTPTLIDASLSFPLKPEEIGTRFAPDITHFTIHFLVAPLTGDVDCPTYETRTEGGTAHIDHRWATAEDGAALLHTEEHRTALRAAAAFVSRLVA